MNDPGQKNALGVSESCGASASRRAGVWLRSNRSRVLWGALALAGLGAVLLLWRQIDMAEVHRRAKDLPAIGVLSLMSLLPLVGFPVSWLHLAAGVRFGFGGGLAAVAFTTFGQHLLGLVLARALPGNLFGFVEPWKRRLSAASQADAVVLCCVLPGMPYSVQLYLLPLVGTPLPLLLLLSPALHTLRAVVTILLGDVSDELSATRAAMLVGYYGLLFVVSAITLRRLRRCRSADGA